MCEVDLSWIIATKNKLPFLKEVLSRLIRELQSAEEIIVIDGGSTDGTVEYLTKLRASGQIHQFISETDKGEAHAWNKGLLMARGELIKLITDDDAFYWSGIRACKEFMLSHHNVDVLGANVANTNLRSLHSIDVITEFEASFTRWLRNSEKPFFFNGLGLMLRRSRLALTGLFHTGCLLVDLEFTLRITDFANLAWYTPVVAVRIENPRSGYVPDDPAVVDERLRLAQFYRWPLPESAPLHQGLAGKVGGLPSLVGGAMRTLAGKVRRRHSDHPRNGGLQTQLASASVAFQVCDTWLKSYNEKCLGEFLFKQGWGEE